MNARAVEAIPTPGIRVFGPVAGPATQAILVTHLGWITGAGALIRKTRNLTYTPHPVADRARVWAIRIPEASPETQAQHPGPQVGGAVPSAGTGGLVDRLGTGHPIERAQLEPQGLAAFEPHAGPPEGAAVETPAPKPELQRAIGIGFARWGAVRRGAVLHAVARPQRAAHGGRAAVPIGLARFARRPGTDADAVLWVAPAHQSQSVAAAGALGTRATRLGVLGIARTPGPTLPGHQVAHLSGSAIDPVVPAVRARTSVRSRPGIGARVGRQGHGAAEGQADDPGEDDGHGPHSPHPSSLSVLQRLFEGLHPAGRGETVSQCVQ